MDRGAWWAEDHGISKSQPLLATAQQQIQGSAVQFSSFHALSRVPLFAAPRTAACQASLSITNSPSLLNFMSIQSVMPSNHLILYRPLLILPSIFPSIRAFSNESGLPIKWPKYWHFSFSISPSNEYILQDGLDGSPCSPRDSQESSPAPQFNSTNSLAHKLTIIHEITA